MKTRKTNSAFTLIEVMICVAIVGLLAVIALSNFYLSQQQLQQNAYACVKKLEQLERAKTIWATNHKNTNGTPVTWNDLIPPAIKTLYSPEIPRCLAGGMYTIGAVGELPRCSIGSEFGHALTAKNNK